MDTRLRRRRLRQQPVPDADARPLGGRSDGPHPAPRDGCRCRRTAIAPRGLLLIGRLASNRWTEHPLWQRLVMIKGRQRRDAGAAHPPLLSPTARRSSDCCRQSPTARPPAPSSLRQLSRSRPSRVGVLDQNSPACSPMPSARSCRRTEGRPGGASRHRARGPRRGRARAQAVRLTTPADRRRPR